MPGSRLINSRLWLRSAFVFVAAWLYLYHLQFQTPWIIAYDGWYHIKYADMLPSLGIQSEFKWAAQSIWAEHFADKQFLYHVYLLPFTWFGDLIAGMKHATILLGAFAVASFYAVLGLNRMRFPLFWTALLFASGSWFLYRLCLPRPHVLSIVFLLWSIHLILNHRRRALAVLIFLYSLSYAAFHVPFALALILSAHIFLTEKRLEWKTPAVILGAMLAGIVVNPYFPETLTWFWTVNVMVPWMALAADVDLKMADELMPMATWEFIVAHAPVVFGTFVAAYASFVRPMRSSDKTRGLFLFFCAYALLASMNQRFIEYSMPVGLLFVAAWATDYLQGVDLGELRRKCRPASVYALGALASLVLAGMLFYTYRDMIPLLRGGPPERKGAALYLKEHTIADELVFTCDWDDAPELFFFNDENRYPVIMDPFYMYAHDPDVWNEWASIAAGSYAGRSYDMLAKHYRYGICTVEFEELKVIVESDPRMEVVFDDTDGGGAWVFRLDPEHPPIPLDQFLGMAPED